MVTDLQWIFNNFRNVVIFINVWLVRCRVIEILCTDVIADSYIILINTDVRLPFNGKVISRVYYMSDKLSKLFLNHQVSRKLGSIV